MKITSVLDASLTVNDCQQLVRQAARDQQLKIVFESPGFLKLKKGSFWGSAIYYDFDIGILRNGEKSQISVTISNHALVDPFSILGNGLQKFESFLKMRLSMAKPSTPPIQVECPQCHGGFSAEVKFCPADGTPLYRGCGHCGKEMAVNTRFCPHCGVQA